MGGGEREEKENEQTGRQHAHELNVYHNKTCSCYSNVHKSI